jgi:Flp pilus assembly protein TadD
LNLERWYERRGVIPALLVAAVFAVYAGALFNGFVWDDRSLIVENGALDRPDAWSQAFVQDFWESELQAGRSSYYRPVVTLTYLVDRALYGVNPMGYHLTNLVAHAMAVVLLARLLREWGFDAVRAAWGAAVFAVHPALAETVAWVSGRTDSVATVALLGALIADRHRQQRAGRWGAPLLFAAALGAKEIAVITPVLAWIGAWGRTDLRQAVRERLDLLAVLAAYFGVRAAVLGGISDSGRLEFPASILALAPAHLYGLLLAPGWGRIEYGLGLPAAELFASAAAGGATALLLRGSTRLEPTAAHTRLAMAAAAASIPLLASVVLKGVIGDRLIYLAAAFALPALASGAWSVRHRLGGVPVLVAVVALSAWATAERVPRWREERSLFAAAMAQPAPSVRTRLNYGIALHDDGELAEARALIAGAESEAGTRESAYMLGLYYTELGCYDRAAPYYRQALARAPGDAAAANNLAGLLLERGRASEARAVLDAAIATGRSDATMRQNRATMAAEPDRPVPSSDAPFCASDAALEARLPDPSFLLDRAVLLLRTRNLEGAKVVLRAAARVEPESVRLRFNQAQYHLLASEPERARELLQAILAENPQHGGALRLREMLPR